jgi:hypothetical protein
MNVLTREEAPDVHPGLLCISKFNHEMTRSFDFGEYAFAQDADDHLPQA